MKGFAKTFELLNKLIESKKSLVDSLNKQNIEASFDDSMYDLMDKAEVPDTIVLVDEAGNEIVGTITAEEVDFTATANDIREGKVAATNKGVTTGEKFIPSYVVSEGYRIITGGSAFTILFTDELFDFTKLQALICPYNSSISKSVATEKVAINDGVYAVNSTELLAAVIRDSETKQINLEITNESDKLYVLRYFTYKEIY